MSEGIDRPGRDLSILALGALPALLLGVVWMRQTAVPPALYLQNVAAAIVGAVIAVASLRRRVSPRLGITITAISIVLLVATLATAGVQGVHRWFRIGLLNLHVAALLLPLVLVELDRLLRAARMSVAIGIMLTVAAILALQPDAGQATAFVGSCVVLLAMQGKPRWVAVATMLALLALAALSFLRNDPLDAVPYVEEIAIRIGQHGVIWQVAVAVALLLLIVPFARTRALAVAVYFALVIAASYWGNFPVPILGYGTSPILGYFAGWAWTRAAT